MSDTTPIPPASEQFSEDEIRTTWRVWRREAIDGPDLAVEFVRLLEARAALSHPSTPQGWKQIGWTCGEGDPEWPDVSPEGLRKMAETAAPNNARVFCAAADVIEALQSRGPRT